MKSHNILLLAALLALAFPQLNAGSPATPGPFAYKVSEIVLADSTNGGRITRGDTRNTVRAALGQSPSPLSADVWVYTGFGSAATRGRASGCEELVVTFADDRVVDLKLVNARALRIIAASLRPQPVHRHVADSRR